MTEALEKQLIEAEKRRVIAEQLRNEAPTLQEKLHVLSEQLSATEEVLLKIERLIDGLVQRSRDIHEEETVLYRKLREVVPKVVAETK